jgi:hypothetical protein
MKRQLKPYERIVDSRIVGETRNGRSVFTPGWRHRLLLDRWLTPAAGPRHPGRVATFVMLNPSRADAEENDSTIRRCIGYARALGADTLRVRNLHTFAATDRSVLLAQRAGRTGADAENDALIVDAARSADWTIAAWGADGAKWDRGRAVEDLLRSAGVRLLALKILKDGHPGHPLYLPKTLRPQAWRRS